MRRTRAISDRSIPDKRIPPRTLPIVEVSSAAFLYIFTRRFDGYVSVGIKKGTEEKKKKRIFLLVNLL